MRRVMLLVLLALALPTAVLADSINFKITPGNFATGNAPSYGPAWSPFMASNAATNLRIQLTNLNLSQPCGPGATCTFTSGTVTVMTLSMTTLFTSNLFDGVVTRTANTGATVTARLTASPQFGFLHMTFTVPPGGFTMISGSAQVATPEPSTLLSLGTGLVGLAGMMKRKLRT
jgi:hypothetical protein